MGAVLQSSCIPFCHSEQFVCSPCFCQLSAHDELAQIIHQQKKVNRGSLITQVPVLAQEGDVNVQGSCGEGRSEESLWWPTVKIRLIHFLRCHFKKKKTTHKKTQQTPKQTIKTKQISRLVKL